LLNIFNCLSIVTEMQCPISEIGNKFLDGITHKWELGSGLGIYFKQDPST